MTTHPNPVELASCSFEFHLNGSDAILLVSGEVDIASAPKLQECIDLLLEQGMKRIDADLRNVSFLDSQGIALLANTHRRLKKMNGKLRVLHPAPFIHKVLKVSGLDRVLTVITSGTSPEKAAIPGRH